MVISFTILLVQSSYFLSFIITQEKIICQQNFEHPIFNDLEGKHRITKITRNEKIEAKLGMNDEKQT